MRLHYSTYILIFLLFAIRFRILAVSFLHNKPSLYYYTKIVFLYERVNYSSEVL